MKRRKKGGGLSSRSAVADSTRAAIGKSPLAPPVKPGYGALALVAAFFLGALTTTMYSKITFVKPEAAPALGNAVTLQAAAAAPSPAGTAQPVFKQPATLGELLALPTADLGKVDLATMNLLCAEGLPGSEDLNIPQCLATLDDWTQKIKTYTDRHYDEFKHDPDQSHSWAEYRMMVIMSALGKGFGVHYDAEQAIAEYGFDPATAQGSATDYYPSDKLGPAFYAKSDIFFINGLLGQKRAGNCSSLPILVAAVSQRLGYPVRLVNTFRHTFVRWDDGNERFNVETTVVGGLQTLTDEEYCRWPKPLSVQMIAEEDYLQPLTPPQELACFLYSRVGCLLANGRLEEAKKLLPKCSELVPSSVKYRNMPSLQ